MIFRSLAFDNFAFVSVIVMIGYSKSVVMPVTAGAGQVGQLGRNEITVQLNNHKTVTQIIEI